MKQVFIVDDDFDIIFSISKWLMRKQIGVQGFAASEYLFNGLEREIPDAILLDVHLKGEDGREICKEIRKRYDHQIPVILFSMAYKSIKQLQDSCADDFIKKDSSLRELTDLLQEHMDTNKE